MIESLLWKARELYNRIVSLYMHINSNLRPISNSNIHFISSLSHRVPKNFNQLANFNFHINCETSALYYQYYIRRGISNNSPIQYVFIVKASYLGQQSISHHRVDAIVKSLVQCFLWSGEKFSHSVIQKIWQTHWERSSMRTFRCSHIWNSNDIIALWAAAKNKKLRRNQEWAPMQQGKSSGVHLKDEIVENFFLFYLIIGKKPKTISTYNYNLIKTNLYIFFLLISKFYSLHTRFHSIIDARFLYDEKSSDFVWFVSPLLRSLSTPEAFAIFHFVFSPFSPSTADYMRRVAEVKEKT